MNPQTNSVPLPEQNPAINPAEQLAVPPVAPEAAPPPPAASPAPAVAAAPAVSVPSQQPAATLPAQPAAPVGNPANPAFADDVDVIEKEWVDQAERVIKATAGDPHAEEEAVEDLQIDYLKKRYGKDVKKSE